MEPCSPIPAHSTEHSCVFLLFTALSTAMCHSAQHHRPSLPSAPHCAPCPHLSSHSAHHTALCGCWEPWVCAWAWAGLLCGAELVPYGVGWLAAAAGLDDPHRSPQPYSSVPLCHPSQLWYPQPQTTSPPHNQPCGTAFLPHLPQRNSSFLRDPSHLPSPAQKYTHRASGKQNSWQSIPTSHHQSCGTPDVSPATPRPQ